MIKRSLYFLIIFFITISAQEKLFQPHDVFRTQSVGETSISSDQNYAVFTLISSRSFDDKSGSAYRELYLYNYSDKSVTPLMTGKVSISRVSWLNDSKYVSFTANMKDDKKSQLYLLSIDGKDTIRVTESESSILTYQWHPSENKVAYITVEEKEKPEYEKKGFNQEIFEENIPGRNLYLLNRETGETKKLNKEGAVFDFKWSNNGDKIAAAIAPNNLVDDSYMFKRIYVIDVESEEMTKLVDNPGKLGNFAWNTSDTKLAFISAADTNDAVAGSLFMCDVPNPKSFHQLKNYSIDFIGSVTDIHWLDEETMLFVSEEGVYTTLRNQKYNSDESELLIEHDTAVFKSINISGNKIVFNGQTPSHPAELFTYYINEDKVERNTFHNSWLNEIKLANQEKIEYTASDGLNIEGMLFYPVNYEQGEKYPMIVYVHGGPEATNSLGWNTGYNRWGQVAAAKDFFVFMPNYRAGSGRGYEFTMMGFADGGGREFIDVLDGIDYLINEGFVDKNRVGIGGGSYGGYFSAWAASKHTEHFAAAVSFVGIGNKLSKRNTTDIPWESYYVHWGYWVNENPMEIYDRSPVRYAENMNTPLLILHGTKDPRVHPSQSLEMFRAFKLKGKAPVRLVWYPDERHGNSRNTSQLDYLLRTLNWFEYYLKGDNPKDSKPDYEIDYGLEYFDEIGK